MTDRPPRVFVLTGSARPDSDTDLLVDAVLAGRPCRRTALRDRRIRPYAYGRPAGGDDFLDVVEELLAADAALLATPVYWYAMSGLMKTFFDRLTDLVTVRKDLGRRLAGHTVYVAACGTGTALPDGFETPFRDTAAYFAMPYGGAFYARMPDGLDRGAAAAFGDRLYRPVSAPTP